MVKIHAGYSVQIPTFSQLYQPSHDSIDQVRGNPDLEKERIWSYDASIKYQRNNSRLLQVSLFRSDITDPIVYQRGPDLIYRPLNTDRSWRQGVKTTVKHETAIGMSMNADCIIQNSKIEETGNELPYTPQVKAKLSLFHTLKEQRTKLEATLRYRSSQYSESENIERQKIDAYVSVDLKATQPFTLKAIAAEWFVFIENLFDVDYQVHYGYPDDGIRFLTGVNLTF